MLSLNWYQMSWKSIWIRTLELLLSPNGNYLNGKKIQYIFGLRVFPLFFHNRKNFSVQRNPILYLGLDLHFRGRGLKIGNKEASRTYTIGFRYLVPVMAESRKDFIFPPILITSYVDDVSRCYVFPFQSMYIMLYSLFQIQLAPVFVTK